MRNIKYLVMDVDGTLTDGKIYIGPTGEVFKAFDIKDGYGIYALLKPHNIVPVIITGRESEIVKRRCDELKIDLVFQGVSDKVEQLMQITKDLSVVAYIGDDLNDIPTIDAVNNAGGITACPRNAIKAVRDKAQFTSVFDGGAGAVRDFIEYLINE